MKYIKFYMIIISFNYLITSFDLKDHLQTITINIMINITNIKLILLVKFTISSNNNIRKKWS